MDSAKRLRQVIQKLREWQDGCNPGASYQYIVPSGLSLRWKNQTCSLAQPALGSIADHSVSHFLRTCEADPNGSMRILDGSFAGL